MGTEVEVTIVGGSPVLLGRARDRITGLERAWSRFDPESEISRLNAADGGALTVSPETITLLTRACEGFDLTHGRFDPFQLDALERVGYRSSFETITRPIVAPMERTPRPIDARSRRIDIDAATGRVAVARGRRFDPGGIGKGLAADLVADELRALGADGVCVNVGGDVRVAGRSPDDGGWVVAVRDLETDGPIVCLAVVDGGVATTSRSRRHWRAADGTEYHHVIDPATQTSAATPVVHATAVAAAAWQAEVLSKVAFLDGVAGIEVAERLGATAMVATADTVTTGSNWSQYERMPEAVA
jgi:thiamine biosynthesis lipoprotein